MSTQLDANAVKEIERIAKVASGVMIEYPIADGSRYFVAYDGALNEFTMPCQSKWRFVSVVELLAFVSSEPGSWTTFVSGVGVTAVAEDANEHYPNVAAVKFTRDEVLERMKRPFTHAEIVDFIRINLRDRLDEGVYASLRKVFSRVKFEDSKIVESEKGHTVDTLGKQVAARATGADQIPEEFVMTTTVFNEFTDAIIYTVRVAISVDTQGQRFTLTIAPDELRKAEQSMFAQIVQKFKDAELSAFQGRPVGARFEV